ncbi:hypothetical protein, partial [Marinitoga sp. 1197]|uniref:hypothetical protein n=1 Tax=Marinitoga sp. 1197 TaxID=1428449 RepID=UPI0012E03A7C
MEVEGMKKYSYLVVLLIALLIILTSCFKAVPVGKLNTEDIRVDLSTNYDVYSQVNSSAIEMEFNANIPKDAFMYDKSNSLILVKNYSNKTVVIFSKAQ